MFQAEDGIRCLVRSRGLGDVYKRQVLEDLVYGTFLMKYNYGIIHEESPDPRGIDVCMICLLYTSDAADERSSVDLGGRRIIKKKKSK